MQAHAYKPSTQKVEAGRLRVEGQPGLHKEIPNANKNMQRKAEGLKIQKHRPTLAFYGMPRAHDKVRHNVHSQKFTHKSKSPAPLFSGQFY